MGAVQLQSPSRSSSSASAKASDKKLPTLENLAKSYGINIKGPNFAGVKKREEAQKCLDTWRADQRVNLGLARKTCRDATLFGVIEEAVDRTYTKYEGYIKEYFGKGINYLD